MHALLVTTQSMYLVARGDDFVILLVQPCNSRYKSVYCKASGCDLRPQAGKEEDAGADQGTVIS